VIEPVPKPRRTWHARKGIAIDPVRIEHKGAFRDNGLILAAVASVAMDDQRVPFTELKSTTGYAHQLRCPDLDCGQARVTSVVLMGIDYHAAFWHTTGDQTHEHGQRKMSQWVSFFCGVMLTPKTPTKRWMTWSSRLH
jgi:hypothetical protein